MADDKPQCLICGKRFASVGHHVVRAHDITLAEYRDRFRMRRGAPLTSEVTRARFSASIRRTINAGALDAHFRGNGARATEAAAAGAAVKAALRGQGVDFPHGTAPLARETVAAVVVDVEAGAKVASAVKRAGISYSAYHAGLARHPDLKVRHEAGRRWGRSDTPDRGKSNG